MLLAGLLLCARSADVFADQIQGTSGSDWQAWKSDNLDQDGKPYWDGKSSDGDYKNIGYYLTGTGFFTGSVYEHPGAIAFWGADYDSTNDTGGGADPSFSFKKDSSSSYAALQLEIAGYRDGNVFGWYDVATGKMTEIFSGPNSPITTATFTPTAAYGFYLLNKIDQLFMTQAGAWTSVNDKFQHFAVFQESVTTYWIGVEDLKCGGDQDFNDMVIKVTNVPEPATMLLVGMGLLGLAGVRRRFS